MKKRDLFHLGLKLKKVLMIKDNKNYEIHTNYIQIGVYKLYKSLYKKIKYNY